MLLEALKLAVAGAGAGAGPPTSSSAAASAPGLAAGAALGTAARLADLAAKGMPLDVPSIAAGIVADAAAAGTVSLAAAAERLGSEAAGVLASVLKVRALPRRVDIYDDAASAALRELALTFYDARACMVEVAARAAGLESLAAAVESGTGGGGGAAAADLQVAALEALQIYAPLGHALGMGPVAAELEDACFRTLFPESYGETARWLRAEADASAAGLAACRAVLSEALAADPALCALASGTIIHARTKSLFSTMKKLLRLDDFAAGGRERGALFDLLGMRVVVYPRGDWTDTDTDKDGLNPSDDDGDVAPDPASEADASAACYRVLEVAAALWEVLPGRTKDYIGSPKENGYRSLHATLRPDASLFGATVEIGGGREGGPPHAPPPAAVPTLELQVRTAAMHAAAECGDAAHTAYKGGLARRQAAALAAWSARSAAALASASSSTFSTMGSAASSSDSDGGDEDGGSSASPTLPLTSSAEALFRHLDVDGDGTVSAAELELVLRDMGSGDGDAAAAAADLVRAVRGPGKVEGGPLTLTEFSELVQRVRFFFFFWGGGWRGKQNARATSKTQNQDDEARPFPGALVK